MIELMYFISFIFVVGSIFSAYTVNQKKAQDDGAFCFMFTCILCFLIGAGYAVYKLSQ